MLAGSTLLLTNKGLLPAQEIRANEHITVYTHQGWQDVIQVAPSESLPAMKVTTAIGNSVVTDLSQKFVIQGTKGMKSVPLTSLSVGDKVMLLTGENVAYKMLPSLSVTRPETGALLNGHITAITACFIGFFLSKGRREGDCLIFAIPQYQLGLPVLFNKALCQEGFDPGWISQLDPLQYTYTVVDPTVLAWLKKNKWDNPQHVVPDFLLTSPAEVVSGFLVGYTLGNALLTTNHVLNFPEASQAAQFQLILFRHSIVTTLTGASLQINHERARAEFDRLFALCNICPHRFDTVASREPFQQFCDTKIAELEVLPTPQTLYRFQVDEVGMVSGNGIYLVS